MRVLTGLLCLVLVAGCGGDDDESPRRAANGDGTVERAPGDAPQPDPAPGESAPSGGDQATAEDNPPDSLEDDPPDTSRAAPRDPAPRAGADADARRIRATIARFLAALRAKDTGASCSAYTREVRNLVGGSLGGDCPTGMDFIFRVIAADTGAFARVRVKSVRVDGNRAAARLSFPRELRTLPILTLIAPGQQLTLERERGRWRLGLPLP